MMDTNKTASSGIMFFGSLIVMLVCGFILMALVDPALIRKTGLGIIDLEFAKSPAKLFFVLKQWGAEGRSFMLHWFWLDYIFPAAYGTFLFLALRRTIEHGFPEASRLKLLSWLPLLAALMDWAENSAEIYLMLNLQSVHSLFALHRFFVYTKWGAVGLSLFLLAGFLAGGTITRQKRQSSL